MNLKKIYRKIAKEYGVSEEEVRNDIEKAINFAFRETNKSKELIEFQNKIPSAQDIPTPEEFISYVVMSIRNKKF